MNPGIYPTWMLIFRGSGNDFSSENIFNERSLIVKGENEFLTNTIPDGQIPSNR